MHLLLRLLFKRATTLYLQCHDINLKNCFINLETLFSCKNEGGCCRAEEALWVALPLFCIHSYAKASWYTMRGGVCVILNKELVGVSEVWNSWWGLVFCFVFPFTYLLDHRCSSRPPHWLTVDNASFRCF